MIIFLGLAIGAVGLPARSSAVERGDGRITFYTYYLKENETVRYRDGDKYLPQGLEAAKRLFRSRDSEAVLPIDPRLLEIIDRIEDHFGVRQVEVISGYRSTAFNKELKATGHAVANESFHTKGMAADIHLDEIDEKTLRDYALSLGLGGVGYYASLDFVHVDAGPVRTWGDEGPRKAWIGEKNETCPVTLTVSPTRRIGAKGLDSLKVKGGEIEPEVAIEFFDRGKWIAVGACGHTPLQCKPAFETLPWGKFRLKAKVKGQPDVYQYSNEFYFKRI
ncbi:MAG TPA: DUF882 domain-containing protein [bacterium]|nr:DUF882 domain-containing protein [bacterium]